jgi:hypothetical protein
LRIARLLSGLLLVAVLAVLAAAGAWWWLEARLATELPYVAPVSVQAAFVDSVPITVTISVPGAQLPWPTTTDALLDDSTLWSMMHVADWNRVPDDLRARGIDAMLSRYQAILVSPQTWDAMTADDWDRIPQPIRMVAFRHMAAYWAGFYDIGGPEGVPPGLVSDTLQAIVMSESWFEHRTVAVNANGTRDLGLAGASDFARARLRQLRAAGRVDFGPEDADYFNPWVATRFAAVWFRIVLQEADGNIDRAIGAYNRGISLAEDGIGLAYRAMVVRRRTTFIRNNDAPVAWDYLWRRARELEQQAWPWMGLRTPDPPRAQRQASTSAGVPRARPTPSGDQPTNTIRR